MTTKTSLSSASSRSSSPLDTDMDNAKSTTIADDTPMAAQLRRIEASARTPFEKSVWALLCQIPPGHTTTYAHMAAHLRSSPRAVGNALRRNPFAPDVPCHRCVATGGGLGGFKGVSLKNKRDTEGITLTEKRTLLRKEGVRFDDRGRVLGTPFQAFH